MNYEKLTITFMGAAIIAGKEILSVYNTDFNSDKKPDGSPVTLADQIAEKTIIERIIDDGYDIPIVSEELASSGIIPKIENRYILVDPLDGTKEFIAKNNEFVINIALIESGRPRCAVVFAPATTEMFLCDGFDSYRTRVKKFSFDALEKNSVRDKPDNGIKVLVSRSHNNDVTENSYKMLPTATVEKLGSALKICRLAEGSADFYPRFLPSKQWDIAAGDCILSSAGGKIVDSNLNQLNYSHPAEGVQNDFEIPSFIAVGDQNLLERYRESLIN